MLSVRRREWPVPVLLMMAVGLLFFGAPSHGAFEWSDAPRHALNGVFVKDALAALPLRDPGAFAASYYLQYPALTILFYPPLFYLISAPFYALLGVSHQTALLVVALHYLAFAWGSWRLYRFWLARWEAGAAALMLLFSPEIASWGRQVMLEVPAFAFLVWSAVFFMRYRREQRIGFLYLAAALALLAMYTKISTAFLLPALLLTLAVERRAALLRDRHSWLIAAVVLLGLVPLAFITLQFGQANVQSVAGIADAPVSRTTLGGWLWYSRQLPGQLGWPLLVAAAAGAALALARPGVPVLARADRVFWSSWFICGYLFFSAIDLKEARHSIFILPPLVLGAALLVARLRQPRWRAVLLAALCATVLVQTLAFRPVLYVKGYAEAASFIARHAPPGSAVLFSGYRDGSFVFNVRAHEERRDLRVVRADKLLLKVAVRRELGVQQLPLAEAEIGERINQLGIHYVVAQPGFWNDLAAMQRFERVLASSQFKAVARIPTPANYPAHETELVIYKNVGKVHTGPVRQRIDLPVIGRSISGVEDVR